MALSNNHHATCLLFGDKGVLILGESGSGKSSLALRLIDAGGSHGFARIVADDQVLLSVSHGRLIARTPPAIDGLMEFWGIGIVPLHYCPAAVIDLLVRLVPREQLSRFPETRTEALLGVDLSTLLVVANDPEAACLSVRAALDQRPPFR